jgi:hypothetical protein
MQCVGTAALEDPRNTPCSSRVTDDEAHVGASCNVGENESFTVVAVRSPALPARSISMEVGMRAGHEGSWTGIAPG